MSKAATKAQRGSRPRRSGGGGKADRPLIGPLSIVVLALAVAVALGIYSPESLPLLGIGMLPTLGAAFAERQSKGIWITVGWLDFAGMANWLLDLWAPDHHAGQAAAQLRSVTPILAAYLSSMGGWLLYAIMPTIAAAAIVAGLKRRRTRLVAKQKKLVEQWDRGIIRR